MSLHRTLNLQARGKVMKSYAEDGLHNLWSPCICHPFQTSSGCMVCDDSEYLRIVGETAGEQEATETEQESREASFMSFAMR